MMNKNIKLVIMGISMLLLLVGCKSKTNEPVATNAPKATETLEATTKPIEATSEPVQATSEAIKATSTPDAGFTVTDMQDRSVTFEQVPSKMVVLLASDVEILYELGAQDSIVAVGEYCNYPEEALKKDIISTGEALNMEQVIALEPEVVVVGSMGQTKEQITQLENAGLKVIVTDSQNIADTYVAIELMGKLSGKETEATSLVKEMTKSFAAIKEKVNKSSEKTVYFEVSPLEYGLWTAGNGTFMQELADIVGLSNVFEGVDGWAEVSEEQVIESDPDYIITSTMYVGQGDTPVEEILGRSNWIELNAVKNNRVYNGNSDMMTRPGPRLVEAANALYKFVYGE